MNLSFSELVRHIIKQRPTHAVIADATKHHEVESHVKLLLAVLMYRWYHLGGDFRGYPLTIAAVNRYLFDVIGKPFQAIAGLLHYGLQWPKLEPLEYDAIRKKIFVQWSANETTDLLPNVVMFLREIQLPTRIDCDVLQFGPDDAAFVESIRNNLCRVTMGALLGSDYESAMVAANFGSVHYTPEFHSSIFARDKDGNVVDAEITPSKEKSELTTGSSILDRAIKDGISGGWPLGSISGAVAQTGLSRFSNKAYVVNLDTEGNLIDITPQELAGNVLTSEPATKQDKE